MAIYNLMAYRSPIDDARSPGNQSSQAPRVRRFSGQWTMDISGLLWTSVDDGLWTLVDISGSGRGRKWTLVD